MDSKCKFDCHLQLILLAMGELQLSILDICNDSNNRRIYECAVYSAGCTKVNGEFCVDFFLKLKSRR